MFELLVRLNPPAAPLERSGGMPELTPEIIAAACVGADPLGLDLMLVKIAGRDINVFDRIHELIMRLAIREHWKAREKDRRLDSLARLIMLEYVQEPRCSLCHGTTFRDNKPCEVCSGSGYIRMNDKIRAVAIGVNPSVWLRTWKSRYAQIVQEINYHESEAALIIRRNLRQ